MTRLTCRLEHDSCAPCGHSDRRTRSLCRFIQEAHHSVLRVVALCVQFLYTCTNIVRCMDVCGSPSVTLRADVFVVQCYRTISQHRNRFAPGAAGCRCARQDWVLFRVPRVQLRVPNPNPCRSWGEGKRGTLRRRNVTLPTCAHELLLREPLHMYAGVLGISRVVDSIWYDNGAQSTAAARAWKGLTGPARSPWGQLFASGVSVYTAFWSAELNTYGRWSGSQFCARVPCLITCTFTTQIPRDCVRYGCRIKLCRRSTARRTVVCLRELCAVWVYATDVRELFHLLLILQVRRSGARA